MKIIKFKKDSYNIEDAHQLVLDIEKELGVNLMNKDANNPNDVHGYVNTYDNGTVEVYLYEQSDVDFIVARSETTKEKIDGKTKTYSIQAIPNENYKKCSLTKSQISTKLNKVMLEDNNFEPLT